MDIESTKSYLFMDVFGWKYGTNVGGCNVGCIGKSTTVMCVVGGKHALVEEVNKYIYVPVHNMFFFLIIRSSMNFTCIKFEQDFLHSAKCRAPAVHSPCLGWYLSHDMYISQTVPTLLYAVPGGVYRCTTGARMFYRYSGTCSTHTYVCEVCVYCISG